MSLAPVDIFIRVGYRFLLSTIVNLYPSNSTRLHFRYSTYRITHVSLVPFHTSQPENCSTDVCNFILLSVTHYTLLRKVVRPFREERKPDARRWPEETFVLCGGKCPFGPQLIRCVRCPWDASEHILDPADLRYPSGTRTTHQTFAQTAENKTKIYLHLMPNTIDLILI